MYMIRKSQRAPKACLSCAQRRVKCDKQVPCGTCSTRGLEASCRREVVTVKGRLISGERDQIPSYLDLRHENARLKRQISQYQELNYLPQDLTPNIELPVKEDKGGNLVRCRSHIIVPTKCCSDALLAHGLTWTAWIHFAVHSGNFQSEHEAAWNKGLSLDGDVLWLAVYFGFIAMSLLYMDEGEASAAGIQPGTTSSLVKNWYHTALFFLGEAEFLRYHDFKTVQAIAILLGLSKNIGDFDLEPVLLASGIKIGQLLGMDCEPPRISSDPIVQELSRRTWWTLIICEWLGEPERPFCIHAADFHVKIPLLLSDDEMLNSQLMRDPSKAPRFPRPIEYHNAMISIAKAKYHFRLQRKAVDGSNGDKRLEGLVSTADEALATIISCLPSHFHGFSSTPEEKHHLLPWISSQQICLSLNLLFYRMTINGTLQYQWVESSEASHIRSKAICLDSAIAIVSLVEQHKIVLARHRPWATTLILFSAALTLSAEAKILDPELSEAHLEKIRACFSFLRSIQDHSAFATQALQELKEFCIGLPGALIDGLD